MSKVRVSIELGSVVIDNLTLAELSELYEELGAFFDGEEECGCEEECYAEPDWARIKRDLSEQIDKYPLPQTTPPARYPWYKPYAAGGIPGVTGATWIHIGTPFDLDAAGIPYFGD